MDEGHKLERGREDNTEKSAQRKRKSGHEVVNMRHSIAKYLTNTAIAQSDTPSAPIDIEAQEFPDLKPEGIELARKSAEDFFATLDPAKDKLFFVSSALARALETGAVYAQVAREKGFTIIQPENTGTAIAEKIGGGDIRSVRNLTLRPFSPIGALVFTPDAQIPQGTNFDALTPSERSQWEKAHAIVMSDDRGSWGANYAAHSERITDLFPDIGIESAEKLDEVQFKNLLRLVKFGLKKAREAAPDGSIKILSFSHENYLPVALEKYFHDHEIKNCEAIAFRPDKEGNLTLERRGKTATLE